MERDAAVDSKSTTWQRELSIAAGLLAFGLVVMPFAIYVVGQSLLGEYAGSGALGLAESVWTDLFALQPLTWLLVLTPYAVVQLARLGRRVWRRRL